MYGCTVPPGTKDTEHGSSNQDASSSAAKIIEVVLVPCRASKYVLISISSGVNFSEVTECHFLQLKSSQ